MTIARAIRRSFRLVPDFREHSNTGLEVTLRNIFDQFRAQVVGSIKNLVEDCLRTPLKVHGFAAAIFRGAAALDPAVALQSIEQASQGRPLDPHPFGDLFLSELVPTLGKVDERSPFSLTQAERAQASIKFRAPGAGGAEEDETEFVDIGPRHEREIG